MFPPSSSGDKSVQILVHILWQLFPHMARHMVVTGRGHGTLVPDRTRHMDGIALCMQLRLHYLLQGIRIFHPFIPLLHHVSQKMMCFERKIAGLLLSLLMISDVAKGQGRPTKG